MYVHIYLLHPRYLDCFHMLAVVNIAEMNLGVCMSFQIVFWISLYKYLVVEFLRHVVVL